MSVTKFKKWVVLFLVFFWIFFLLFLKPNPTKSSLPYTLKINSGSYANQIASELKESNVVRSAFWFKFYLKIRGLEKSIKSGVYVFRNPSSIYQIVKIITKGKEAYKVITFPEGLNSREIASKIKKHFKIDSLIFLSLVSDSLFAKKCGIDASTLEGFLYPETYYFPHSFKEPDFLITMTKLWKQKTNGIDFESSKVYQKYGFLGVITLASIVEEEALVKKEKLKIAGVFYNRLLQNWSLGADPTVRYFLDKLTGPLTKSDLNTKSPYNTRIYRGLPPAPISNPGRDAILAALNPQTTEFMFFVAKDDGSGEHFFSKTNSEHNKYKQIRKKNQQL